VLVALHALADVCKKLCVGRLYLEYTKDNGVEAAKTESVQLMQVAKLMGEGKGLSVKEEAIAAPLIKIKKEIEAQCEEYLQDKEARNKKAFAVIDVNGDGKLQEQEVVDALTPGHAKNIDLREALGLLSKQEKLQRKMQETARKKEVMRANGDVEGLKKLATVAPCRGTVPPAAFEVRALSCARGSSERRAPCRVRAAIEQFHRVHGRAAHVAGPPGARLAHACEVRFPAARG
jgi:hypothetical protein